MQSMARRLAFLAALACSNTAAFVVPLSSRAVLQTARKAAVLRRSARAPDGTAGNTAPNMRYVAMNRYERAAAAACSNDLVVCADLTRKEID